LLCISFLAYITFMTMKRYCSNFPARIYSSADSGSVRQPQKLGKVHSAVLPLEVQFTQFLSNVSNWHSTWKAENHFLEWSGVSVFEGDMPDTGMQSLPAPHLRVIWCLKSLSGSPRWELIPSEVFHLDLSQNNLKGGLPFSRFPETLLWLNFNENYFSGEIDWSSLPSYLSFINISFNDLRGAVDLTNLPDTLQSLSLSGNRFTGNVQLGHLPKRLITLELSHNKFAGELDLGDLPESLSYVSLNNNKFNALKGTRYLPITMSRLYLMENCFKEKPKDHLPAYVRWSPQLVG